MGAGRAKGPGAEEGEQVGGAGALHYCLMRRAAGGAQHQARSQGRCRAHAYSPCPCPPWRAPAPAAPAPALAHPNSRPHAVRKPGCSTAWLHAGARPGSAGPARPRRQLPHLEIAQHDGDLRARDQQDDEHQREEAKQVVELRVHGWGEGGGVGVRM